MTERVHVASVDLIEPLRYPNVTDLDGTVRNTMNAAADEIVRLRDELHYEKFNSQVCREDAIAFKVSRDQYRTDYYAMGRRCNALEEQLTRLYEQDALHTEARGMLNQMAETYKRERDEARNAISDGITSAESSFLVAANAEWRRRNANLAALLLRLRAWDMMDSAADGAYWRKEIDALLAEGHETEAPK